MPTTTITDNPLPVSPVLGVSSVTAQDQNLDFVTGLWAPRFPSADLVHQAAALLPAVSSVDRCPHLLDEGPHPYIRIGPGVVEVRSKDFARAERTAERAISHEQTDTDLLAAYVLEHGCFPDEPAPTRVITEWSRKSRANMVRTLGLIDFTPMYQDRTRMPAMLTLTYPGDWLTVASSGKQVKAHLKAFRKRYERAWNEPLLCVWKLEFQRRGAPHIHMLMVPPHGQAGGVVFRQWVSQIWADVVAHPDPQQYANHLRAGTGLDYAEGLRASDPKRVAVYFTKHSTFRDKEYQHVVPEEWLTPETGPGRFWGYWGLQHGSAVVEVSQQDAVTAGRTLRRWSHAQRVTHQVSRPRTPGGRVLSRYPEVVGLAGALLMASQKPTKYRESRGRVHRMKANRGFVMVNDGSAMVSQLARYLDQVRNTQ